MHTSDQLQGALPPERVQLRVRAHARRLLLPVLLVVCAAAAAGYWGGSLPDAWMNVGVWAGAILCACVLVVSWLRWVLRRTVITQRRVILSSGVLVHHRAEVPFSRIREVRSRRTLVQQAFRSGNVVLVTSDATPVVIRDVSDPESVCDALRELIDAHYLRSQGVPQGEQLAREDSPYPFAPERISGSSGSSGNSAAVPDVGDADHRADPSQADRAGFRGGRFTRARR